MSPSTRKYIVEFTLDPPLPAGYRDFLPPDIRVSRSGKRLVLRIEQDDGEEEQQFKTRVIREVERELQRIGVMTKHFSKAVFKRSKPGMGTDIELIPCHHEERAEKNPIPQPTWSTEIELRFALWQRAEEEKDNLMLRYGLMQMICESKGGEFVAKRTTSSGENPQWHDEVYFIRNLLLHGSETPKSPAVQAYLKSRLIRELLGNGDVATRSVYSMRRYERLANLRLPYVRKGILSEILYKDAGY